MQEARYPSGQDRWDKIIGRRSIIERLDHIEPRVQLGNAGGDTVIGADHQQAIMSIVERKSLYAIITKVINKTVI